MDSIADPGRSSAPHAGVVRRLRDRHGLAHDTAAALFDDLTVFLRAAGQASAPMIPSASLDDAWHLFLLYSRDYAAFCAREVGHFVHHDPHDPAPDADDEATARERTAVARNSRIAARAVVADGRPRDWPHHRAASLPDRLAGAPVVQDLVVTLIDAPAERVRYLESPLGWLGERRAMLDDDTHLALYDFFGGALRSMRVWPAVTAPLREYALGLLMTEAPEAAPAPLASA